MSFVLSTVLGGVTGIVGKAITAISSYKIKKLELKHKEEMMEKEIKSMKEEIKLKTSLIEEINTGEIEKEEAKAFTYSIKNVRKISDITYKTIDRLLSDTSKLKWFMKPLGAMLLTLVVLVDIFSVGIRPGLTTFYTIILGYITYHYLHFLELQKLPLTPENNYALVMAVIDTLLYITATCTSWWFADRDFKRHLDRVSKALTKTP